MFIIYRLIYYFRFGSLAKSYPGGIGPQYQNNTINDILEYGLAQCCSFEDSNEFCHLYYEINPPDTCANWSPDDEPDSKAIPHQ